MSFSSKTKNELTRTPRENPECLRAELAAIARVSGTLKLAGEGRINIDLTTKNAAIARHIFSLFKQVCRVHTGIRMHRNTKLKKLNIYTISIERPEGANDILEFLGIIRKKEEGWSINQGIPKELVRKGDCRRAYLRGAFMGGGSLSDPERAYHLELVAHSEPFGEDLMALMRLYDLNPRMIERKGSQVVYLKEGDQIIDFLNIIGAHQTLLAFENTRIMKQMRNDVNRIVNCETANLTKTVDAAYRQIQSIKLIEKTRGLDSLSEGLARLARLRLANPEASLKELGQMLEPPIGKSGVNHRLKKIERIANGIDAKRKGRHDQ